MLLVALLLPLLLVALLLPLLLVALLPPLLTGLLLLLLLLSWLLPLLLRGCAILRGAAAGSHGLTAYGLRADRLGTYSPHGDGLGGIHLIGPNRGQPKLLGQPPHVPGPGVAPVKGHHLAPVAHQLGQRCCLAPRRSAHVQHAAARRRRQHVGCHQRG